MTWSLGLAAIPSGVGAAVITPEEKTPRTIGFFQDVDRALRFCAPSKTEKVPESAVLVLHSGITDYDRKWYVGELIIAGIPVGAIHQRLEIEVFQSAFGENILQIDADHEKITTTSGSVEPFDAERVRALLAELPETTKLIVVGHEETRDGVIEALEDYEPMLLDRPEVAALALQYPVVTGPVIQPVARSTGTALENQEQSPGFKISRPVIILAVALTIIVILAFMF
ncbi:hypothetical protein [Corynebacterium alimapuense]|uniref:Uncharacterized protein n=1 Tax=Corynebacterium alimapuense TaxID=1576874 RepID=A0A3M8K7I2_9CORY|nr:hypothetical protein [Corynebacterium alimapuense]RNE48715.1 hypothetical protein C5L39_05210 [Corynebacterium alimapuense]